jgi:hypothetical protein
VRALSQGLVGKESGGEETGGSFRLISLSLATSSAAHAGGSLFAYSSGVRVSLMCIDVHQIVYCELLPVAELQVG